MARQTTLGDALADPIEEQQEAPAAAKTPAAPATKKAASPRKKSQPAKQARGQREPAADTSSDQEPRVLATDTTEAKRVGLYLHPDDYRELALAKIDDGADLNSRVRAMVALWRANSRFRTQVNRLARTAPRGGL